MAYHQIPEPGEPIYLGEFLGEKRRFPAVYFLYHRGEVVYVGQSKTLEWRIEQHLTDGVKKFDAVGFIRCSVNHLNKTESYWIKELAPKYNNCGISKKVRQRDSWRLKENRERAERPDAFAYHVEIASTTGTKGENGETVIRPKDIGKFLMITDQDAAELFGDVTENIPFMHLLYLAVDRRRELAKASERFEKLL